MSYPFSEIEKKWQDHWHKEKTFRTPDSSDKPKYYVLDMFPYPSGAGLHVGHPEGYTATDIVARYKRMKGFNVLHPMGWDAFGLPAERYAMQTKIHPAVTTAQNIDNFRRQLQSLGFSYDWDREINTTDPSYYKWTQWIFLKIYNSYFDEKQNRARPISELSIPEKLKGEKNKKKREEFINSRRLAYIAEAPVNWCPGLGTVLANEEVDEWVSKGYTVERRPMRQWMLRITAYAERLLEDLKHVEWPAGTLELQKNWIGKSVGARIKFSLKDKKDKIEVFTTRPDTLFGVTYIVLAPEHPLVSKITQPEQKRAVEDYIIRTRQKSELERKGEKGEKTGMFTGSFALHPFTGEEIPIWTADYVLMGYGTGCVMAVPAHDQRDFEFAKRFHLPVKIVLQPATEKLQADHLKEAFESDGVNVNSDFLNGLPTPEAKQEMIRALEKGKKGGGQIHYRLRDWLFSRQRYWGEPIPVSFDSKGNMHSESESNLPLLLPPCEDFNPAETGESPLANLKDWVEYKSGSEKMRRETNTMPQWAGSCWYYLRFIDPTNKDAFVDPEKEKRWMGETGVDLYIGGAEHAVLHLLYARFWHKVLLDLGYVSSVEPFKKLVHQGIILGEDGTKMSKSRGNVVNPDSVVAEYGADSFRLYEMFMGPLEMMKPWSSKGIEGVFRFLSRVWRLYTAPPVNENDPPKIDPALLEEPDDSFKKENERLVHSTIKKITEDLERLSFNTAISQLMIFVNETYNRKKIGKEGARSFLILLSPFAPHIAEELWQMMGKKSSISTENWPSFDDSRTKAEEREIVFQINGKIRAKAMMSAEASEEEMKKTALLQEHIMSALAGQEPKKIIVVKNKLVNIVI